MTLLFSFMRQAGRDSVERRFHEFIGEIPDNSPAIAQQLGPIRLDLLRSTSGDKVLDLADASEKDIRLAFVFFLDFNPGGIWPHDCAYVALESGSDRNVWIDAEWPPLPSSVCSIPETHYDKQCEWSTSEI